MHSALEAGEFPAIVHRAHRLAGAAGALGLEALGAVGRTLERDAAAADARGVRTRLEALARELDRALARHAG